MTISEFHIEKGNIKTGLHLMAEILNDLGTDHAFYDSITIRICQRATSGLKKMNFFKRRKMNVKKEIFILLKIRMNLQ